MKKDHLPDRHKRRLFLINSIDDCQIQLTLSTPKSKMLSLSQPAILIKKV
ncbi:hypothetical protein YC2023_015267 [Brassica napus]